MISWAPRTLADDLRESRAAPGLMAMGTGEAASDPPPEPLDMRGAPCCRRTVRPALLVDVSGLPEGLVRPGVRYLCDACMERLILSGQISRADMVAALGGPPEVVERIAERVQRTGRP